jgi:hypothetical protein
MYALRYFAIERGWEFYNYHSEKDVLQRPVSNAVHYGHFYSTFLEQDRRLHPATGGRDGDLADGNGDPFDHHDDQTNIASPTTRNCLKMTLLRDPIDRVISHFYYWHRREEEWPMVATAKNECENDPELVRPFNQFSK